MSQLPLVVFIHGPTGTGKTEFASQAAQMFEAEVINCDSVQVYDSLHIGAAKPSPEQLSRAPHHLIGHVAAGSTYTAGEYRRDALEILESRARAGCDLFFVVGGSGFYSQALLKGMFPVPKPDPDHRERLKREADKFGLSKLFEELKSLDAKYAAKIGPNDRYRIMRALEILDSTDFETMSEVQAAFDAQTPPFRFLQIGLRHRRDRLREKIEARTEAMLKNGLVDETRGLLERGLSDWPALRSVGYQEACDYLSGRLTQENLKETIVTSTMQLSKRQMTWFRRDSRIHWFDTDQDATAPFVDLHESTRALRLDRGLTPPDTKMALGAI